MSSVVSRAITRLQPNAEFVIHGTIDSGYTIDWHSVDIDQPNDSDLNASIIVIQTEDEE